MRYAILSLPLMATSFVAQPAQADPYPWCAFYTGSRSGSQSCYFMTFQQCLDHVSGIGGFCGRSPYYTGPSTNGAASSVRPRKHRRHH